MNSEWEVSADLISLRTRVELLEQDLSHALHLFHGLLLCVARSANSDFKHRTIATLEAKFFQMPQGFSVGRALVDLDKQFGSPLETHGVILERWVFQARGRWNG
jgi:hypothetical protein